ncbi:hypothetical protein V6R21_14135 [Limibacter armeniacum]|uniref:hypothetical protein n=1 Tax=Limibacter armeniacum TaxID=466084 RepID=UPI002FE687E5
MYNDPELNGKYLGTITTDFIKVASTLKEGAYQVRARDISDYPIFPICKDEANVGQLLLGKHDRKDLEWNYYISFAEEFIQRNLITDEKMEEFVNSYKNPDEFCCLFVIDKEFVNFVYVPYPLDEEGEESL